MWFLLIRETGNQDPAQLLGPTVTAQNLRLKGIICGTTYALAEIPVGLGYHWPTSTTFRLQMSRISCTVTPYSTAIRPAVFAVMDFPSLKMWMVWPGDNFGTCLVLPSMSGATETSRCAGPAGGRLCVRCSGMPLRSWTARVCWASRDDAGIAAVRGQRRWRRREIGREKADSLKSFSL